MDYSPRAGPGPTWQLGQRLVRVVIHKILPENFRKSLVDALCAWPDHKSRLLPRPRRPHHGRRRHRLPPPSATRQLSTNQIPSRIHSHLEPDPGGVGGEIEA